VKNGRGSADAVVDADYRDSWLAIDSVLGSLAERSRRYPQADEPDELDGEAGRLREQLEAVTGERDQLRRRLRAAQKQIRSLRAALEVQAPPRPEPAALVPVPPSPEPETIIEVPGWVLRLLVWRSTARGGGVRRPARTGRSGEGGVGPRA
jgi:hypothetical protein